MEYNCLILTILLLAALFRCVQYSMKLDSKKFQISSLENYIKLKEYIISQRDKTISKLDQENTDLQIKLKKEIPMKDGKFESPKEMIQALLDGKKIKAEYFAGTAYLFLNDKGIHYHFGLEDTMYHLSFGDPEKWFIHKEPKQKVKLYKYAYSYAYSWNETSVYYKDDCSFLASFGDPEPKNFIKIISSMIEVEE